MARWPAHLCMGAWINMEPALCEKEESKAREDPASHQDVGPPVTTASHCIHGILCIPRLACIGNARICRRALYTASNVVGSSGYSLFLSGLEGDAGKHSLGQRSWHPLHSPRAGLDMAMDSQFYPSLPSKGLVPQDSSHPEPLVVVLLRMARAVVDGG